MVTQVRGDIVRIEADVIVNPTNVQNTHGGGVDLAISQAAGQTYAEVSNSKSAVPMGQFLAAPAGDLRAQAIIDIPTLDLATNQSISLDSLKQVWREVLLYCQQHGYRYIATPLLGAGAAGYSEQQIIELLTSVAHEFNDLDVQIMLHSAL